MIYIENLNYCYSNKCIYSNKSLYFENGVNVLIGKNGSGKTTLLNIIYKYIDNYNGKIFIANKELKTIDKVSLRQKYINYISQTPILFNDYTVEENINMLNNKNKKKILELMDLLNTSHLRYENIYKLSGGEKQKIHFIINFVSDNPIILIDEPFNNLDSKSIKIIDNLIAQSNKCIIIVAHNYKFKFPVNLIHIESNINGGQKEKCYNLELGNDVNKKIKYHKKMFLNLLFILFCIFSLAFSLNYIMSNIEFESVNSFSSSDKVIVTHVSTKLDYAEEIYPLEYLEDETHYPLIEEFDTGKFIDLSIIEYNYNNNDLIKLNNDYIFDNGKEVPIYYSTLLQKKEILDNYIGEYSYYNIDSLIYGDFPKDNSEEILIDINLALKIVNSEYVENVESLVGWKYENMTISGIYYPKDVSTSYIYRSFNSKYISDSLTNDSQKFKYHTYYMKKEELEKIEFFNGAIIISDELYLKEYIKKNFNQFILVIILISIYVVFTITIIIFDFLKNKKNNLVYEHYGMFGFIKKIIIFEIIYSILIFILLF